MKIEKCLHTLGMHKRLCASVSPESSLFVVRSPVRTGGMKDCGGNQLYLVDPTLGADD